VEDQSDFKGSAMSIVGNMGTNDKFRFTSKPGLTGNIYFNGTGAGWSGSTPSGYTIYTSSKRVEWKTVDEIAREFYPSGTYSPNGLDYIATHNNNASAVPAITSNSITKNVTLKGPGHYYVTNLNLTGSRKITFDNALGSVYLWIGPRSGSSVANFRGGSSATTTAKTNTCYIFCATEGGIDVAGNERLDAVVYNYNEEGGCHPYGYIEVSGNPDINGAVIAASVLINGNVDVTYRAYNRILMKSTAANYVFDTRFSDLTPGY
jgi:hypothetical protein